MRRHTHTHTHTHTHIHTHTHTYTCTHACMHAFTCTPYHTICAYRFCTHACTHTCSHMHPHTHIHTHTHTCTHSDTVTCMSYHTSGNNVHMNYTLYAHMYACACTHSCMCVHTHTHTNTQHRQPKSRSARLYSLLFARLRCISDARGRNGDTNDDDSDNQDPVLASALAYLSELKEKLNVYRLTGENLAGSIISWS